MKNIFRIVMAVAILFTASCAKEDISSTIGGGEVEVTFTADLGQLGTRAYGEAENVDRVYLGVYEANSSTPLTGLVEADGYAVNNGQASITVVLLKDKKYDLVFWAQNDAQTCYTMQWEGRYVTVNYTGVESQNDARDAFFLVENDFWAGHDETTFRLYRPFAQLNAGLSAEDVEYIGKNGVDVTKFQSKVVVKQVATKLNLLEEATDTAVDVDDFVDVTFAYAAKPTQALTVNNVNYEYLSMNYLLVDAKQNVDLTYTFRDGEGTEYVRPYYSVPVQRNYRTNILGQLISSPMEFNVIIVPDFIEPGNDLQGDTQTFDVYSQTEFEDALAKAATQNHIQHLVINLYDNVKLDVDAWQTLAIGNKNTKDITINGSKTRAAGDDYYTLTFNNTNSDWNNIATNGAKLILENLKITNDGHDATSGTWNAHGIIFACEVEMNYVVSLNAIALKAGATLNNTTINDDHAGSSYAVWIQPNGQTVTINNCKIDSTGAGDGRGIKIDEQYVDAPAKVVLNVSKTTFVTESKAAIVVKSKAGAKIAASELNIAGVAADSEYAVWVDEDAAAYYDLVEVSGALVRLEGSAVVDTQDGLLKGLKVANAVVYLEPTADGSAHKLEGKLSLAEGVKLIGVGAEPVKVFNDWGSNAFANQAHFTNTHIENINFTNNLIIDAGIANGNVSFKNCVFGGELAHQGVHFDSGNGVVVFDNCTFVGRNMLGSSLEKVIFNNCTFLNKKSSQTGADKWTGVNMWGKYEFNNCTFDTEAHCNVKCDGVEADFYNCTWNNATNFKFINNSANYNAKINFHSDVESADELVAALESGQDVVLTDDVKIEPASMSNAYGKTGLNVKNGQTIDGGGHILDIKGAGGTWDSGINTTGGLIKNITVTGSFRGIFINHNSDHCEKVVLENVIIEGTTYTISCDEGSNNGFEASNSTFKGWTSYAGTLGNAKFTNCYFGKGGGYAYFRPYAPTEFVGCEFEAGYRMDARAAVTFENCTLGGVAITAENVATLVTSNTANATVK